jgi:hypothetical protein
MLAKKGWWGTMSFESHMRAQYQRMAGTRKDEVDIMYLSWQELGQMNWK